VGQFDPGQSLADPNIEMIQRAGLYANEHLIFARFGVWNVFVHQHFGPTEFVNANGFHKISVDERR
jgi:hypothetical protein